MKIFNSHLSLVPFMLLASCQHQKNDTYLPPNIVVILADDMGYGDLSSYGATGFSTPNLDKLAMEGIRFTNFYVSQPVCSASRASLLTGCYSNRIGIKYALGPGSNIGLNPEEETIAEILRERGYKSMAIGKWHLGDDVSFLP
ncbi:MAG: sulfatase-like hydrolase/transferase, partial [Draconibacterium sp.]